MSLGMCRQIAFRPDISKCLRDASRRPAPDTIHAEATESLQPDSQTAYVSYPGLLLHCDIRCNAHGRHDFMSHTMWDWPVAGCWSGPFRSAAQKVAVPVLCVLPRRAVAAGAQEAAESLRVAR